MNNNNLALLISLIKLNISRNKLIAKVPNSKLNIKILKILYTEGYIRGFNINQFNLYVFLKPAQIPVFRDIAYFPSNNKKSYISYKKLIVFFGLKNFLIISTNIVY